MTDKRFSHIVTDPKFRVIPKHARKIKIDKRFQSMFKEKQFKVKYTVDKRGRPVNHTSTEDLKRYYELNSDEEHSSEDSENGNHAGKYVRLNKNAENSIEGVDETVKNDKDNIDERRNELSVIHKYDEILTCEVKKKLKNLNVDYARGESNLFSETSSDEESEEETDTDSLVHKWGELDNDADTTEKITYRLAACNMDWDRIKAVDLMILFTSFVPTGGLIKSVVIYPSEFGKKRMQEEEIKGPIELVESKKDDVSDAEENEEGSKYHMEKLRLYQLNRLKYYYAVITCDSVDTANKIYTECDGMEYESSATKIDLRFIPDDMTFDVEPKELCDKLPDVSKYQPRFFTTKALQQAKVDLTWDETNPDRIEITKKLFSEKADEVTEVDIQMYLASSSGEESEPDDNSRYFKAEDDTDNPIDKYKALLQEIEDEEKEKKNKDVEMEITWGLDLKNKTEQLVKKKIDGNKMKTPFEQIVEKRKERIKQKRELRKKQLKECSDGDSDNVPSDIDMKDPYFAEEFKTGNFKKQNKKNIDSKTDVTSDDTNAELELLLMNDDNVDDKKHFSLQNIQKVETKSKTKKKWKHKKHEVDQNYNKDDFEVNVNDQRFAALFTSHHFNIDPTDPHYKNTKGTETLIKEKLKRRNECDEGEESKTFIKKKSKTTELNMLVKSVKRKTQAFKSKSSSHRQSKNK